MAVRAAILTIVLAINLVNLRSTPAIRFGWNCTALRHGLLSYPFGAVILVPPST
jgi:hypothetical protein